MCNRYTLIDPDSVFGEIARILGIPLEKPKWVTQRYNLGLMQVAPVVVNRGAGVEIMPMQFGNGVQGGGRVFGNARSETILEKRTFKKQVASHRCLIPTTGFIDWETGERDAKFPHLFTLDGKSAYTMAAIWNAGNPEHQVPPHFYIVTTEPNELVGRYHDRMPVILPDEKVARWVDPAPMGEPEFRDFAKSFPSDLMREREISDFANNVRHEGPECIAPAKPRLNQLGLGL